MSLEGKDYFTEREAADYCGVCHSQFRRHRAERGIQPLRFMGKLLYRRADLQRAIERETTWLQRTNTTALATFSGRKTARGANSASGAVT